MKTFLATTLLLAATLGFGRPTPRDPFRPDLEWKDGVLSVTFVMEEPDCHIYDDMLTCTLGEPQRKPKGTPDGDGRIVYEGLATFTWAAEPGKPFTLRYQGCDAQQCYMPQRLTFTVAADGAVQEGSHPFEAKPDALMQAVAQAVEDEGQTLQSAVNAAVATVADAAQTVQAEAVAPAKPAFRSIAGFHPPAEFIAFLRGESEQKEGAEPSFLDNPSAWLAAHGVWLLLLLVFAGGLALNLTPCVLPMMPINLAIIGAGAAGGSRSRGFLRGGAYGLGIALAYGILALIPALTGSAFGAIQSAWWFNAAIAVVFVVLALALFDLFMIDFTRFAGQGNGKQGAIAAFVAGAVSAVLAGACVAPVLLAVLLLTADLVASGVYWALGLPFVLGLGMAAPWPIAGAGLSFLPKPGAWMVWVKKIFGVVVLLFAARYGWTAVKSFLPSEGLDGADLPAIQQAIETARAEGKPVLLDFWGTACKACDEMERDTFPAPEVQQELARFTFLKVRMDLSDAAIAPTQEAFDIKGLPTYIVIE